MAELKITYETLFDLLRRERNREELQELDAGFYEDVAAYLVEKKALVSGMGPDGLTMSAESERARIQYHNIKKILKEIYDRREKKITNLALNSVRTGMHIDQAAFLAQEKLLFHDLMSQFSRYRRDILDTIFAGSMTPMPSPPPTPVDEPAEKPVSSPEPVKQAISTPEKPLEAEESPVASTPAGKLKVKFLKPVPRFAGVGEDVLGPFSIGDVADLPNQIASVLLKKGRVEQV